MQEQANNNTPATWCCWFINVEPFIYCPTENRKVNETFWFPFGNNWAWFTYRGYYRSLPALVHSGTQCHGGASLCCSLNVVLVIPEGTNGAILVCLRCDECLLCYHFGCLDPPLKKSPKQTGYGWICQECDTSSSKVNVHNVAAFLSLLSSKMCKFRLFFLKKTVIKDSAEHIK